MEIIITEENFESEVLKSDIPVLVDFFATWCGPCKMLAPIVERIADNYDGRLKVGKCDIDAAGDLPAKMDIMSVPTLKIFKAGQEVHSSVGVISQADLEGIIDGLI